MEQAFNEQVKAEFWSASLYLGMAFWFSKEGWKGFASWMYKQADEERQHAMDIAKFVIDRGGRVTMPAVEAVKNDWESPKEIMEYTLRHEQEVTEMINRLADVAEKENDRASAHFIDKFIDEQVEEERSVQDILDEFDHMRHVVERHVDKSMGAR